MNKTSNAYVCQRPPLSVCVDHLATDRTNRKSQMTSLKMVKNCVT